MKKKLSLLLVCVFAICITLSGCNLFVTDAKVYYDQPVATMAYTTAEGENKTITITKEDLAQSYSRYYSTLSQYGYSGEGMITYLTNYLIEQEVVLNEVSNLIAKGDIVVGITEKNDIYESTLESMESLLNDYKDEVIEDWNINKATSPEAEEEDEVTTFEKYTPKATIIKDGDEYKIVLVDNDEEEDTTLLYNETDGVVNTVKAKLAAKINNDEILKEAQKRYIASLKSFQEERHNTKFTTDELWTNEITRVLNEVTDNKYINLYTEYLEKMSDVGGVTYDELSLEDVLTYLEHQIKVDYLKYSISPSTYTTDILESRDEVYYCLHNADEGEYFYVSHILIKFGDDLFTDLDAAYAAGGMSSDDYNAERQRKINQLAVELYGDAIEGYENINTLTELVTAVQNAVNSATNVQDKFDIFNKFVYAYSQDSGNKNKDYEYVVGTKNSQMVEPFTDAARELYNAGEVGAISGMVESEYGIHIVMYLGDVENTFNVTNADSFSLVSATGTELDRIVTKITTTKLSVMNTKTVFDLVYDTLATDNLSILQQLNVETLKSKYDIKTYPQNVKDMY